MGFTGFEWVLLGFTGFYWVLLGFTGFYWVLLDWDEDVEREDVRMGGRPDGRMGGWSRTDGAHPPRLLSPPPPSSGSHRHSFIHSFIHCTLPISPPFNFWPKVSLCFSLLHRQRFHWAELFSFGLFFLGRPMSGRLAVALNALPEKSLPLPVMLPNFFYRIQGADSLLVTQSDNCFVRLRWR